MKNLFYVTIIILFLGSCADDGDGGSKDGLGSKKFTLHTSDPENSTLQFYNISKEELRFSIKLNGKIFYDQEDISAYIKKMSGGEPDYRNAWRFVNKNTYHIRFFSRENYFYSPLLLINSTGFANCGMRAGVLGNIWKSLGYKVRVWHLEGHVVPEIFVDGRWEMYDPDMGVFYLNKERKICGYDELVKDPSLITNPLKIFESSGIVYEDSSRYSKTTASLYSTISNNFLFNWKVDNKDLNLKFEIVLPPKASFSFPAKYEANLFSSNNEEIKDFSDARLVVPPKWKGQIDIPLVIHRIRGKGEVAINGNKYEIGSEEIEKLIDQRNSFIYKVDILNSQNGVEIIYLVNPLLFKLEKTNILEVKSKDLDKIRINIFKHE